jgi:hypothetical protein
MKDQIQLPPRPRPPFWGIWPSTPTWALAYSSTLLDLNARKRSKFHQTPQKRVERERGRGRGRTVGRLRELGVWGIDGSQIGTMWKSVKMERFKGFFFQMSCVATDGKYNGFLYGELGLSSIDLLLRAVQLVLKRVIGSFQR